MAKAEFRDFPANPLAEELGRRHEAALLEVLKRLGDDIFMIDDPEGLTRHSDDDGWQRLTATDDQAAIVRAEIMSHVDVSLNGDYVEEILDWLRELKRRCARAIRSLEVSRSAGTLDLRTIHGYVVEVDGEEVYGPARQHEAMSAAEEIGDEATVRPLYEDEA